MAHSAFNAAAAMVVTGAAMTAGRDQAVRMLQGAVALRAANADLASARQSRALTLDRLAASEIRLARARAARAALRG